MEKLHLITTETDCNVRKKFVLGGTVILIYAHVWHHTRIINSRAYAKILGYFYTAVNALPKLRL